MSGVLNANVYYSKVEPYEIQKISSNVLGVVIFADENMIGKKLSKKAYLEIDSQLDRDELKYAQEKLEYLRNTVATNEKMLSNLNDSLQRKRKNYDRVKKMKIKSSVEKDREFYDLVASENSYLATLKEINSLKTQITDLKLRKAQLLRSIKDKKLSADGYTLYSLDVKVGQVVNKGTPLATVVDTNKAILTIYLNAEDVKNAKKDFVYIDGKKTSYRVDRLLDIADSKNISKYKAQIIVDAPELFSKLVKVELKDK
jgi:multidrug efflux pump subunit AcrA (membrane-fusion protein)